MSKVPTIHETSKFLKNLREVTKLKTKTPSAPQTANAAQKSRPTDTNPNRRDKAPNQRHSHPYYFSAEQQHSPIPSANTSQLPVKSHSKPKTAHMTNIEGVLYSVMEQHKKKIATSTSQYDPEFSEDPSMLQMQAHPLAVSAINTSLKPSQLEAAITRQLSNAQNNQRKGGSEPKKTTSLAHIAAHSIPSGSSKVNSNKLKGRKSVASDKGRVMTQAEEPGLPRIPIPYQAQRRAISPARFENRAQNASSKSPIKNIVMPPEVIQQLAGDDIEYVERTPKQNKLDGTPNSSKPPRPLKEIKIDIANLVDEPVLTGNSTNNRASTSRNQAQNLFASHRGEKGKQQEKTSKPWVPLSTSTPQSAATAGQGGIKQRLSLATPKKDQVEKVKDNARMLSLKSFLSEDELRQYGDRFPEEFEKTDFLGRGGFALVWLGVEKKTGKKLAVKQILKGAASDSQKKELYFGQLLFNKGGEPRDELKRYPGIENVAKFIEHKSSKLDDWHTCELGGKTLAKQVFDLKGEFFKSERIYKVNHLKLYQAFRSDGISLRMFMKQMAQVLYLLSDLKIVHCDLKPDNILINMDSYTPGKPFDLKVIDFGSAYHWDTCGNIGMATPEYMPPEFLDVLISHRTTKSSIEQLADIAHPWSIDVWSLGAIILEIITGIPLWMSLKCRVDTGNKNALKLGLFAVKGRSYDKIYQKQRSIMEKFGEVMGEHLDGWRDAEDLYSLLSHMMEWDPASRISPAEMLQHPYLRDV